MSESQVVSRVDEVGEVERHGVDHIPDAERGGGAHELAWVWLSAQLSFGVVVIGTLPVVFGLGWWSSVTALLVGTLVGTALFAPVALFGPRTGTNDAVSSGAHFGVRGRAVGSLITIFVALGFYALAIWTGGDAIVQSGHRLFGLPAGDGALAVSMAVVSIGTALAAIYGHATLLATYKVITVIIAVLLGVLVVSRLGHFDAGYSGGKYLLGDFTKTWILAVSVGASVPISYATFAGDYTRYLRRDTGDRTILTWNAIGMFVSAAVSLIVGAFLATQIAADAAFVQGLADVVPDGMLIVVLAIGLLGAAPQGALCLYNTGLAANGLAPRRISRVSTTVLFTVLGTATVYLAVFAFDAIDSITAFVLIMLVTISPWLAIMLVGFVARGGEYHWPDLFATGDASGRYWFTGGVNWRALVAFVPAAIIGFLFSSTTIYTGPLVDKVNGLDLSYASAFVIAAVIYGALLVLAPERATGIDESVRYEPAEAGV